MATNQKQILQEQEDFRKDFKDFKQFLADHGASLEIYTGECGMDDIVNSFDLLRSEFNFDI